ncbi:MAG: VWA domain-containing protein, partial [Crenarchaeota archaeon]|nr:VWA domain-containing protein [Thermoproteota archaeon]
FSNSAVVDQAITSDTSSLISAINNIVVENMTALLNGTLEGLKQLSNETNTRAVIVFSDGVENYSTVTQAAVIDYARQNNITIYSIGIGSSADRSVLEALANSTGGYFTSAPSAAQLAQIYAQIKSDIQSKYILCYRSPDEVFNGDTHQVVVTVNLNNHTDRDTVYWNENNQPPLISLTAATQAMLATSQQPNQPLTISANITDDGTISSARLFYRPSNLSSGAYTEVTMQNSSGSLYQATIPATSVNYPGIDFYILATDNYQLIGRSPNILAPETQPWVIPVGNNVPTISDIQASCLYIGNDNSISAKIDDDGGINLALLYYKKRSETFFAIDTMTETTTGVYSGTIPSNMATSNGIDYYIRAVDNVGAAARYPSSGYDSLFECTNDNHPPVANAGTDSDVYLTSGCNATVSLDGSASRDPDGDQITYNWTGPFSGTLTDATPSVSLPTGQHIIVLKVTDRFGLFDLDTVLINVIDTISPVFSFIPADTTILIRANDSTCQVSIDSARASDNCTVKSISATRSDNLPLGSVFKAGLTTITWIATDL